MEASTHGLVRALITPEDEIFIKPSGVARAFSAAWLGVFVGFLAHSQQTGIFYSRIDAVQRCGPFVFKPAQYLGQFSVNLLVNKMLER